jgi:hypothetical protein
VRCVPRVWTTYSTYITGVIVLYQSVEQEQVFPGLCSFLAFHSSACFYPLLCIVVGAFYCRKSLAR